MLVQAVGICASEKYFPDSTEWLRGPLSVYGVDLRGSAAEVLNRLRSVGGFSVTTSSYMKLFTVVVATALSIEFIPNDDWAEDASDTRLGAIQFNFGPRFTHGVAPVLASPTNLHG